jgi:dienelactone hydrolase
MEMLFHSNLSNNLYVIKHFSIDMSPKKVQKNFDRNAWRSKHTAQETRPSLDKVITWLKEQGVKEFAAVGYCFGGKSFEQLLISLDSSYFT